MSVYWWFVGLAPDAKIQLFVLITLILTLVVGMLFEILKLRKRITFLDYHIFEEQPMLAFRLTVSNNCRRIIRLTSFYAISISGLKSHDNNESKDLSEGEKVLLRTWFPKKISMDDVHSLILTDSVNKPYVAYLYKGRFTNKWLARFHWLKNALWTKVKYFLFCGV